MGTTSGADGANTHDLNIEGAGNSEAEGIENSNGEGAGDSDIEGTGNSEAEGIDNSNGEGAGDSDIEGTGNLDRYSEIHIGRQNWVDTEIRVL